MSFCPKSFHGFPICLQVRLVTLAYKALDDPVPPSSRPAALPCPRHPGHAGLALLPFPSSASAPLSSLCAARSPQLRHPPGFSSSINSEQLSLPPISGSHTPTYTPSRLFYCPHTTHHDSAPSCVSLVASRGLLPLAPWGLLEKMDLVCAVSTVSVLSGQHRDMAGGPSVLLELEE